MALNALIAQGAQFNVPDPMNQFAKISQIQQTQQQNQLNRLKMDEYARALQEQEGVRNYLTQPGLDLSTSEGQAGLLNFGKTGLEYGKALSEQRQAALTQKKVQSELVDAELKRSRQFLEGVTTPEQYLAWHEANHQNPILGPVLAGRGVTADTARKQIENALKQPGGFETLLNQSKLGVEKFAEMNKPTTTQQNLGGTVRTIQTPGLGGAATVVPGSEAAVTMTPAQIAQNKIAQGQLDVSRGQLGVAQQRLAQEGQSVTYQQDAQGNIIAMPSKLAPGVIPTGRAVIAPGGGMEPLKGKLSPFAEKAAAQKTQMGKDLGFAIKELGDITKEGGLIDQSTGSGAGRLIDIGAGFTGQATPGAIAIGKIAPIADLVLKMVPRFEGPQSDKDTKTYKEAAGQLADPTLPREIRKEAGKTVMRLMQQRKDQFTLPGLDVEGAKPAADTGKWKDL